MRTNFILENFILETMRVAGRGKTLTAFGLLAVMVALLSFGAPDPEPAHAQPPTAKTFTVNSTADAADKSPGDGSCFTGNRDVANQEECTLRAAIQEANAHRGADKIHFNISSPTPDDPPPCNEVECPDDPIILPPGDEEVKTISPASALPLIRDGVTIDGYTQPGAKPNTKTVGNDAVLKIELRGSGSGWGLDTYWAPDTVVVRGLAINRFFGGIFSQSPVNQPRVQKGKSITLQGNFIGTDASGTTAPSDGVETQRYGVMAEGTNIIIGGPIVGAEGSPAHRNVISGNAYKGIEVAGRNNSVQGNYIGTTKDGTGNLGNGAGVVVAGWNNIVGDRQPGNANTIAFNSDAGVAIRATTSTGNRFFGNSIFSNGFSNGWPGIDLRGNGAIEPNDPKDPDRGPNNLQNHPELTFAQRNAAEGTVGIIGKLNSTPGRPFSIQFFATPQDDKGSGAQGKTWVGNGRLTTDDQGDAKIQILLTGQRVSEGDRITATATDEFTGDTSEFSNFVTAVSDDEFEWEDETF
jgi:CSLREA domain-containing protein